MGNNFHGSDLERIEREYGIRKEEIVRFGANVNPLGLSEKFKTALAEKLDVITSYPDREYNRLREVIAAYCGTRKEYVLVGNGSTDLLSLITRHCRPGTGPGILRIRAGNPAGRKRLCLFPHKRRRRFHSG